MTALTGVVVDEISRRGPITFARFMELALYHPKLGYYSSGARRTGWEGHFVTSPELDPAFGELWARGFAELWHACGRPEAFEVVELGAGEATFAQAVLSSAPPDLRRALRYRVVEPVARLRARQRRRLGRRQDLGWSASLPDVGRIDAGCVFANEVLDNQPVHLVTRSGGRLRELVVAHRSGRLVLVEGAPSGELAHFLRRWRLDPSEGGLIEAPVAAERFVRDAAAAVRRGAVVLVDYGLEGAELAHRTRGTVVAYGAGGADESMLEHPGGKDITAHVNWTLVRTWLRESGLRPVGPRPQAEVLANLGAPELDRSLADDLEAARHEGRGAAAVRALSRRQALAALRDPAGLGGLGVMVGLAGIEQVEFLGAARARERRRSPAPT